MKFKATLYFIVKHREDEDNYFVVDGPFVSRLGADLAIKERWDFIGDKLTIAEMPVEMIV